MKKISHSAVWFTTKCTENFPPYPFFAFLWVTHHFYCYFACFMVDLLGQKSAISLNAICYEKKEGLLTFGIKGGLQKSPQWKVKGWSDHGVHYATISCIIKLSAVWYHYFVYYKVIYCKQWQYALFNVILRLFPIHYN